MYLVYKHFPYTLGPLFGLVVEFCDGAVLLVHEVGVHLFQFPERGKQRTMGVSYNVSPSQFTVQSVMNDINMYNSSVDT